MYFCVVFLICGMAPSKPPVNFKFQHFLSKHVFDVFVVE